MRILALDSSQAQATVCAIDGERLLAARTGSITVAHSEALLPHLDEVLRQAGITLADIDLFAAGVGPGSFTGIRIGCATVKALAQVTGKPVIGFSSLRALSLSVSPEGHAVAMSNAYQGQVFVGWTSVTAGHAAWLEDAAPAAAWCEAHPEVFRRDQKLDFCGDGAGLYWSQIAAGREDRVCLHPEILYPSAVGIHRAVVENQGKTVRYLDLSANYLRASQAELKLRDK